jgi:AcrR family transcriptional regulator
MAHQSSRPRLVGARVRERPARPGADPEKRSRILKAAILIFGRRGFHNPRGEIARAAGVADGTVYLYFENKGICSAASSTRRWTPRWRIRRS